MNIQEVYKWLSDYNCTVGISTKGFRPDMFEVKVKNQLGQTIGQYDSEDYTLAVSEAIGQVEIGWAIQRQIDEASLLL